MITTLQGLVSTRRLRDSSGASRNRGGRIRRENFRFMIKRLPDGWL
jgi:hypothetical protein